MTRIVVSDAATLAQFQVLAGAVEVCDPTGKVLGTYSPQRADPTPPSTVKSPYSAAQLDEFEQESGRPLTEIWKSLGRT